MAYGNGGTVSDKERGLRPCYSTGIINKPNGVPAAHQVEQALDAKSKGIDNILLGDLNTRLEEPRDVREKDLDMSLADHVLKDVARHFTPRRRYKGQCLWKWHMKMEVRKVTRRGDYVLVTARG